MATAKRVKRTPRNVPKGYDSWFEHDLHQCLINCEYHRGTVEYIQTRRYEPDFVYTEGKNTVYIEAKGRFRDSDEARKYVDIKKVLGPEESLAFIFYTPSTAMPKARRRKDRTRYCMSEWADKHGFDWYTIDNLPIEWIRGEIL